MSTVQRPRTEISASTRIIGRESEMAAIDAWLRRPLGAPRVLLIEGDAGIGKTVLWLRCQRRAAQLGYRVLAARPSEVETRLSFSAVGDLLREVERSVTDVLPAPQRQAVLGALLQAEQQGPVELRGVALGLLSILRDLARGGPILVAVDDAHWIDETSAQVLTFALRRLDREPALLLATVRRGTAGFSGLLESLDEGLRVLDLAPLPEEALCALLRCHLARQLSWPLTAEVHRLSGGNPAQALAIGRTLELEDVHRRPGEPWPLPPDLGRLTRSRTAGLSPAAAEALVAVAALRRPDVASVEELLGANGGPALAEAAGRGLLEVLGNEVRVIDPLALSAVYWDAGADRRRGVHARLATQASDPAERVRHLALSSTRPAAHLASQLEEAAAEAAGRGVLNTAEELAELGLRLTPDDQRDERARRRLVIAELRAATGHAATVADMLEAARSPAVAWPRRARLLRLAAQACLLDAGWRAAADLLTGVSSEMGDSPLVAAEVDRGLALAHLFAGDLEHALAHGRRAFAAGASGREAPAEGPPDSLADGGPFATIRLLEAQLEAVAEWPGRALLQAQFAMWGDDLTGAVSRLRQVERRAREAGNVAVLPLLLGRLAEAECWRGRWLDAVILARRGYHMALGTGQRALRAYHRYVMALADIHLGDLEGARQSALRGEELAVRAGFRPLAVLNRSVLGHLELALGNPAAAQLDFLPLVEARGSVGAEPGVARFLPDAIEALIAQREIDDAARLIGVLETLGRQMGARWPLAAAARCRAALESAEGHHAEAQRWSWRAIEEDRHLDRTLDLGRDLLTQGLVLRRHGNRRSARAALEHAHAIFARLDTAAWRERAGSELERAGGPRGGSAELGPRERLVAELVAQGLSAPEIAARLSLDVMNVESQIRSAYRKLGVRSRSSLAYRMGVPPP